MSFQDGWPGRGVEEYYKRFIELQERLRKSEEERLQLEMKFNGMIQVTQEEEQLYFKRLKTQYKQFIEENHKRQERNEKILLMLERIESRAAIFESKSKRLKLLRNQYYSFLNRVEKERNFRLKENETVVKEATLGKIIDQELPKVVGAMQISEKRHTYDGLGSADQLLSRFKEQSNEESIADAIMKSIYERNKRRNNFTFPLQGPVKIEYDTDDSTTESVLLEDAKKLANLIFQAQNGKIPNGVVHNHDADSSNAQNLSVYSAEACSSEDYTKDVNNKNSLECGSDLLNQEKRMGNNQLADLNQNTLKTINLDNPNKQNDTNNVDENTFVISNSTNQSKEQEYVSNDKEISDMPLGMEQIVNLKSTLPQTMNSENYNVLKESPDNKKNGSITHDNRDNEFTQEQYQDQIYLPDQNKMAYCTDQKEPQRPDTHKSELKQINIEESSKVVQFGSEQYQPEQTTLFNDSTLNNENTQEINYELEMKYNQNAEQTDNTEISNYGQPLQSNENIAQVVEILEQLPIIDKTNQEQQQVYEEEQKAYEQQEEQFNQQQYDENGQPIYESNNMQYDESGQAIQYDTNGQQVYYDENGQQIYYDQNEEQYAYNQPQYDENGQPVAYNPNYDNYQYDENGKILNFQQGQENVYYDDNGQPALAYNQSATENPLEEQPNDTNQELPEGDAVSHEATDAHSHKANVLELLDTESESTLNQKDAYKGANESDFDFSSTSEAKNLEEK